MGIVLCGQNHRYPVSPKHPATQFRLLNELSFIAAYIRSSVHPEAIVDVIGLVSKYVAGGFDGNLIVGPGQIITLQADRQYEFINICVRTGGVLTVNAYEPRKRSGGTLLIRALKSVVIERGGKISVFSKGYRGGREFSIFGGGGGYGTRGESNTALRKYDNGGHVYGDELLTELHLGAGGGGGFGQVSYPKMS